MERRSAERTTEEARASGVMDELSEELSRLSAADAPGDGGSSIDFATPTTRAVPMPAASDAATEPSLESAEEFFSPAEVPLDLGNRTALPEGWAHPHPQGPQRARQKQKRAADAQRAGPVPRSRSTEELIAAGSSDFALVDSVPLRRSTTPRSDPADRDEVAAAREYRRRSEAVLGARTTIYHADRVIVPRYPTMPYGLLVGADYDKAKTLKDQLLRDFHISRVRFDEDRGIEFFCTGRAKQEHAARVVEEFVRRRSTLVFDLEENVARDTFDYVGRRKDIQAAAIYLDIKPLVGDKRNYFRIVIKGAWWDLDKAQALVRHERQDIVSIINKAAADFAERRKRGRGGRAVVRSEGGDADVGSFDAPHEQREGADTAKSLGLASMPSVVANDVAALASAEDIEDAKEAEPMGFDGNQKTALLAGDIGDGDFHEVPGSEYLAMESLDVNFEGLRYGGAVSRSAYSSLDPTMAEAAAQAISTGTMGFSAGFDVERRMPDDYKPTPHEPVRADAQGSQFVTKVTVDKTTVVGKDARAMKEAVVVATEAAPSSESRSSRAALPGFMLLARAFRRNHPDFNEDARDGAAVDAADDYDSDGSAFSATDSEGSESSGSRPAVNSARLLRRIAIDIENTDQIPTRLASELLLWQIWLQAKTDSTCREEFSDRVHEKLRERGETFLESLMMLDDETQCLNQLLVDCLTFDAVPPSHRDIRAGGPKKPKKPPATRSPPPSPPHSPTRRSTRSSTRRHRYDSGLHGPKAGEAEAASSEVFGYDLDLEKVVRNALASRSRDAGIDEKEVLEHMKATIKTLTSVLTNIFGSLEEMVQMVPEEDDYLVAVYTADEQWHHWLFDIGTFLRSELAKVRPFAETVKMAQSLLFDDAKVAEAESKVLLDQLRKFIKERVEEPHAFADKTPQAFLRDELRAALRPFVDSESCVDTVVTEDSAFRLLLPDACGEAARRNARFCIEASDAATQLPNFFYALLRFRMGLEVEANGVVNSLRFGMSGSGKHQGGRVVPKAMQDVDFFQSALALRLSLVHREVDDLGARTRNRGKKRPRKGKRKSRAKRPARREEGEDVEDVDKEPLQAGAGSSGTSGEAAPMDSIFTEFSFRYMRVRKEVPPDGDCGFRAVGLQLRRSAEDMRAVVTNYLQSSPLALQGFFAASPNGQETSDRRQQLLDDAKADGLFSDGHAKAVAEALGVRIWIVEGRNFSNRMVRCYRSDANQTREAMKRDINDPSLGVTESDVVLVCDRDESGTEHCDPVVPANLHAVLETLTVIDVGYKKWEIRSGGFKCTGFYKKFDYADACLAHLLLYRQRRGNAEKATFAKTFGFPWSEDVNARITAELHRMPGVSAFTCDCARERCEERAQLKPLHRALIMKHYVEAFKDIKEKQRRSLSEAEENRWKEAGKQCYADFRTQIGFLFDTVKKGGAKKQAASLATRGAALELPPDWRNAEKLIRNPWLRLSAYMEITRREEERESGGDDRSDTAASDTSNLSAAGMPTDAELAAGLSGKQGGGRPEVSPELSPEPMAPGGPAPMDLSPSAPATPTAQPPQLTKSDSMDMALEGMSIGLDVDTSCGNPISPEPWANDADIDGLFGEAIAQLEGTDGPDFLDWEDAAALFAPSDDMDLVDGPDDPYTDPSMLSTLNLPGMGRNTNLNPSLTDELQFVDGSTFRFMSAE